MQKWLGQQLGPQVIPERPTIATEQEPAARRRLVGKQSEGQAPKRRSGVEEIQAKLMKKEDLAASMGCEGELPDTAEQVKRRR